MKRERLAAMLAAFLISNWGYFSFGQAFTFKVRHGHWRGRCTGSLTIGEQGIEYRSEDAEHSRNWRYSDLKRIDIQSTREIELLTYEDRKYRPGAERKFEFKLLEGEITDQVHRLLLDKSARPILTRIPYEAGTIVFEVPVKHRHRVGGCQGELQFEQEGVIYRTDKPGEARIWQYRDISTVGLMDSYTLRITTLLETYTFDLKLALLTPQYDFLWAKVYQLENPYPGDVPAGRRRFFP